MADPKTPPADKQPEGADKAAKEMTAAQAAKLVRRPVTTKAKDGTVTVEKVAVKADEVLSFKDYGTHVVVVTIDGQKFSSADAA